MHPLQQAASGAPSGDDAEKSIWISFADLMTALMVLFLLVMTVSLLTVARAGADAQGQKQQRQQDIAALMATIEHAAQSHEGIKVDGMRRVIDFGDRARFDTGSHALNPEAARRLRAFVPELLAVADSADGQRLLQRIVVEGFADPRGSYLMNLNLSLQRAQRVLCVLLDPADGGEGLTAKQRQRVRELFAVGGFSFNAPRASHEASRRIELRIEFGAVDHGGHPGGAGRQTQELGECALDREAARPWATGPTTRPL
jgi:outer membrane protein OmpA-like peptidoglycan-associated protein